MLVVLTTTFLYRVLVSEALGRHLVKASKRSCTLRWFRSWTYKEDSTRYSAGETGDGMGTRVDTVLQKLLLSLVKPLRSEPVLDGSLAEVVEHTWNVQETTTLTKRLVRQQSLKYNPTWVENNTLDDLRAAEEMGGSTQLGSTPGS